MNCFRRLAERNGYDPDDVVLAILGLIIIASFSIAMIISTTVHIHAFSKTPISISGRLQEVDYTPRSPLKIHVDGDIYVIRKVNKCFFRTFGLHENMTLREISYVLDQNIGRDIHLKYLRVRRKNQVVQLSVDGVDYIDENLAVVDFIGYENTTRWIGIVILSVYILLFVLSWKGIIP